MQNGNFQTCQREYKFPSMKGGQLSSYGYSYLKRFKKIENKNLKFGLNLIPQVRKIGNGETSKTRTHETPTTFNESPQKISILKRLQEQLKNIQGFVDDPQSIRVKNKEKKETIVRFKQLRKKNSLLIQIIKQEPIPRTLSQDLTNIIRNEKTQKKHSFINYSESIKAKTQEDKVFGIPFRTESTNNSNWLCKRLQAHRNKKIQMVKLPYRPSIIQY